MVSNVRQRTRSVLSAEESSQSSIFHDDDFGKKRCPPLIETRAWLYIFLSYFSIFLLVLYCDLIRFPSPETVESLQKYGSDRSLHFSEERARNFVLDLSSIGPKPTGSYENEVVAVDYIMRQLNHIKSQVKPVNRIDIDLQKTSGCFDLAWQEGMTSCYDNVKNIVAKIGPKKPTNKSILVNCHFDSVPTSPGASDNIVSCAIMLEVLTSLSQHDQALSNEVIFLFNGAEENILQAAHGFITQHSWAKTVVGFVNLEACGAGGKQMLFQTDREKTWLLLAYAKNAPFPVGSVAAQDIFQNGLIPSDTDYRIFEQFGNIPGLDFAYIKNGYVYHTKFDVPEAITEGAIQQAGLNLLNLIHNALKSQDMIKVEDQSNLSLVFFDFLGIFMIVYPTRTATIINILIILLSIVEMILKSKRSGVPYGKRMFLTLKAFLVLIGSLVVAYLFCVVIAVLLNFFNANMSWYRSPYLVTGLYGCSSLAAIVLILSIVAWKEKGLREKWLYEDVYFDAARLLWICLLVIFELAKINSSFICCAWVLFPTLIRGVVGNMFNFLASEGSQSIHIIIHICMQILPLSIQMYSFWSLYAVFIPIMGRLGAGINPEFLIGLITSLFVFLSTSYMFSLIQVMVSSRKVIKFLLIMFSLTFSLVAFTPFGFPYSGNESKSPAPMRLKIMHTERTFYNKTGNVVNRDSGYWIVPLDYNGPKMLQSFLPQMKDVEPVDCDAELACGMPFYVPVIYMFRKSYYIPAPKPKVHGDHKFQLISKTTLSSNTYRLSFAANGPNHMSVVISPRAGVELSKWSLTKDAPFKSRDWMNRPTYFIYYSYGEFRKPWKFSIDLKVSEEILKDSALIDLTFNTHYIHGNNVITGDFSSLLNQIPSWAHTMPRTCTLDMFVF